MLLRFISQISKHQNWAGPLSFIERRSESAYLGHFKKSTLPVFKLYVVVTKYIFLDFYMNIYAWNSFCLWIYRRCYKLSASAETKKIDFFSILHKHKPRQFLPEKQCWRVFQGILPAKLGISFGFSWKLQKWNLQVGHLFYTFIISIQKPWIPDRLGSECLFVKVNLFKMSSKI